MKSFIKSTELSSSVRGVLCFMGLVVVLIGVEFYPLRLISFTSLGLAVILQISVQLKTTKNEEESSCYDDVRATYLNNPDA